MVGSAPVAPLQEKDDQELIPNQDEGKGDLKQELEKKQSTISIPDDPKKPDYAASQITLELTEITDDESLKNEEKLIEQGKWKHNLVTSWGRFSCLFISPIFLGYRHRAFVLIELLLPPLVALTIVAAFTNGISWKKAYYEKSSSDKFEESVTFEKVNMRTRGISEFRSVYASHNKKPLIYFTPVTNITKEIIHETLRELFPTNFGTVGMDATGRDSHGAVGVPNELELLEKALMHRHDMSRHKHSEPIGIVFKYNTSLPELNPATMYPYNMKVYVSTFSDLISATNETFPYVQPSRNPKRVNNYVKSGFVGLQYAMHTAYVKKLIFTATQRASKDFTFDFDKMLSFDGASETVKTLQSLQDIPGVYLHMIYYPNFYDLNIRWFISFTVGIGLVTSYLFTSFFIVRQVVSENKVGIQDLLRIHGMPRSLHWIIIGIHCFLSRGITAALMTGVLFLSYGEGAILQLASPSLIFVILWIHLIVLTFFNYCLASRIRSVSAVGFYSVAIGLLSFLVPLAFISFNILGAALHVIFVSLFPNWALYNIIRNIVEYESSDQGFDWKSIHSAEHISGPTSIRTSYCIIIMVCSGIFYLVASIISDLTKNMGTGIKGCRFWHIFQGFKLKKTNQQRQKEMIEDIKAGKLNQFPKPEVFEEISSHKKCTVRIRNLCKRYGEHVLAVDSLNLNIYHNEITVILGHSGSGKSTLISILAGKMVPTSGYATIENFDCSFNTSKARNHTGLCSQELTCFQLLTVKQHIFLSFRIRDYHPDSLTNDELRRLAIAMALVDSPTVLLLDEPTSNIRKMIIVSYTLAISYFILAGMDTFERREIWSILKSIRRNHTIIFTTNFMDEAEVLGDRIAFISHGKLVCFGSVEFLRQQYDTGYFLKLYPMPHIAKLDAEVIVALLRGKLGPHVREKRVKYRDDVEKVIIELPRDQLHNFADTFDELDIHQMALGIKKYTVKQVGLNDIFIKICEAVASDKDAPDLYVRRDSIGEIKTALATQIPDLPLSERYQPRIKDQMIALVLKRWTYLKTKHDFLVLKWLVPLAILILIVSLSAVFSNRVEKPKAFNFMEVYEKSTQAKTYYQLQTDVVTVGYDGRIRKLLGKHIRMVNKTENIPMRLRLTLKEARKKKEVVLGDVRRAHSIAVALLKPQSKSGKSGLDVEKTHHFVGYHASGALHSAPLVLDIIMNTILSSLTPLKKGRPYRMQFVNDPFPDRIESNFSEQCDFLCVILSIVVSFSFCLISSSLVTFPMMERAVGIKYLQIMTGVHPVIYWLADYVCDSIPMLFAIICIGIIFRTGGHETFVETQVILVLLLLAVIYFLWTGMAYNYFMSTVISLKFVGFNFLIVMHLIFGIVPFIMTEYLGAKSDHAGVVVTRWLFFLFPGYTLTCAIEDWLKMVAKSNTCNSLLEEIKEFCTVGEKHDESKSHVRSQGHFTSEAEYFAVSMTSNIQFGRCCERICSNVKGKNKCFKQPTFLSFDHESVSHPHLITNIMALLIMGLVFWLLLIVVEKRVFARFAQRLVRQYVNVREGNMSKKTKVSKDLREEAFRVSLILNEESFPQDVAFVVEDLTKSKTSSMVINGFNLEVKVGECVGILGSGGSGKSALVKMIVGESIPTKGMCYIADTSLSKHRKQYLASIGYCAQYNTLFESFSGIQMLSLMGRLRGIPRKLLPTHVAKWLAVMGLGEVGHTRCGMYRLGMRRRLCFAMALIGNSPILVLDEVSTGVDPVARERIWAVLEHLRAAGHTVLFTSYCTQECIHLTTKLVIIAEGNVQCLGTPKELQRRFARGYCITIRIRNDELSPVGFVSKSNEKVNGLKAAIEQAFIHIDLIDEQDNILLYFLRDTTRTWGDVFRNVELICKEFEIISQSYDITEATIEDLFVLLTSKHKELNNPRHSISKDYAIMRTEPQFEAVELAAKALHTERDKHRK